MTALRLKQLGIACLCAVVFGVGFASAQSGYTFSGTINSNNVRDWYAIPLRAGEAIVVTADAIDSALDTVISLYPPGSDQSVANNDDRDFDSLNSAFGYIAEETGVYTLEITRYEGSVESGDYEATVIVGSEEIFSILAAITRVNLGESARFVDTEHFRIHYTLDGKDAITEDYLDAVVLAIEDSYTFQIEELGFTPPPSDDWMGGDSRYDVYLKDLIGTGEGALGYAVPESVVSDNPNSPETETRSSTGYLLVENDFHDVDGGTPIQLMRATIAHEFHHIVQFGYDHDDSHGWISEATSTYTETITFPEDQDATGYVAYAYQYPELCFGTVDDPGFGQLQYGEWAAVQMMADTYGQAFVADLWRNIAQYDGFEAIETTLSAYGTQTLPDLIAAYRTRNLARDYDLAPLFDATVWLEEVITDAGRWTYTGEGIQELGANYFSVGLDEGAYYAGLINDDGALTLYALGVNADQVDVIPLERGGVIEPASYEHFYLMVFNPNYDENLTDCVYYDYEIDVSASDGKSEPVAPAFTWNARYFEALR